MENENIGTMQVDIVEKPASATTEASSPPSPSGDKTSTMPGRKSASDAEKSDAASTIAGAMLICKDFGIKVDYANVDGSLLLIVHGVQANPLPSGKLSFQYVGA